MENKVIITLYIPHLDYKYDMYIPVNKRIHVIIDLMKQALFELSEQSFDTNKKYELYNYENGLLYNMNDLVRDTDIRNNSKLVMV